MIASWFSIARKCEELPLQRDVRPTSTNPQLMASRGNGPQQPHILHWFHVHNSCDRLKKKERKYTRDLFPHLLVKYDKVSTGQTWRDNHNLLWKTKTSESCALLLRQDQNTSFTVLIQRWSPLKSSAVVISDNFFLWQAVDVVRSSDSGKQAQLSLVASSWTSRP